jgi:hypothetical protein
MEPPQKKSKTEEIDEIVESVASISQLSNPKLKASFVIFHGLKMI